MGQNEENADIEFMEARINILCEPLKLKPFETRCFRRLFFKNMQKY